MTPTLNIFERYGRLTKVVKLADFIAAECSKMAHVTPSQIAELAKLMKSSDWRAVTQAVGVKHPPSELTKTLIIATLRARAGGAA